MPKLKPVPCLQCKESLKCMEFLVERAKEYDEDRDGCEDYNSESIYMMGLECAMLSDFLFLGEVSFPSRNYHYFWWPELKSKISEMAWIKRNNKVRDYYDNILVPGTM